MDDFAEKLRSLLSDEESLNQIRELYEAVSGEKTEKNACEEPDAGHDESAGPADDVQNNFDFSTLIKLQNIFGNTEKEDAGTALITALRPHLSAQRQEKADKAVKILNLLNTVSVLKESGLLSDMF